MVLFAQINDLSGFRIDYQFCVIQRNNDIFSELAYGIMVLAKFRALVYN